VLSDRLGTILQTSWRCLGGQANRTVDTKWTLKEPGEFPQCVKGALNGVKPLFSRDCLVF